jgi:hypothetical protein
MWRLDWVIDCEVKVAWYEGGVNIFSSFIRFYDGIEVCKPFLGVARQLGEGEGNSD